MPKLTERLVERAPLPTNGQQFIRDSELTGFALRLTVGAKTFVYERRIKGRPRRITIGQYPDFSIETARKAVQEINLRVWRGEDPTRSQKDSTFAQLEEAYFERHANKHKRERSRDDDRAHLKNHVPGSWRTRRLSDITRDDVEKLHAKLGNENGHYPANQTIRLLRCMFNLGGSWSMFSADKPAAKIRLFKETKRERYLKPEELQRVNAVLIQEQDWRWKSLFPLLHFTGCRLSELLFAKWSYVDLDQRVLTLPMTKDGDKHILPLSTPAAMILEKMPGARNKDDYLFPNTNKNKAEKAWSRIRERAGIPDVRIHDLRHTLASWMAGEGYSLQMIGKALNHAQTSTTERYSHLDLDPIRRALEQTAALMVERGRVV
jgi:integrase